MILIVIHNLVIIQMKAVLPENRTGFFSNTDCAVDLVDYTIDSSQDDVSSHDVTYVVTQHWQQFANFTKLKIAKCARSYRTNSKYLLRIKTATEEN